MILGSVADELDLPSAEGDLSGGPLDDSCGLIRSDGLTDEMSNRPGSLSRISNKPCWKEDTSLMTSSGAYNVRKAQET